MKYLFGIYYKILNYLSMQLFFKKGFVYLKLKNDGNACFANAVVQCLLSCGIALFKEV